MRPKTIITLTILALVAVALTTPLCAQRGYGGAGPGRGGPGAGAIFAELLSAQALRGETFASAHDTDRSSKRACSLFTADMWHAIAVSPASVRSSGLRTALSYTASECACRGSRTS